MNFSYYVYFAACSDYKYYKIHSCIIYVKHRFNELLTTELCHCLDTEKKIMRCKVFASIVTEVYFYPFSYMY